MLIQGIKEYLQTLQLYNTLHRILTFCESEIRRCRRNSWISHPGKHMGIDNIAMRNTIQYVTHAEQLKEVDAGTFMTLLQGKISP